jgi:hypothetical protein
LDNYVNFMLIREKSVKIKKLSSSTRKVAMSIFKSVLIKTKVAGLEGRYYEKDYSRFILSNTTVFRKKAMTLKNHAYKVFCTNCIFMCIAPLPLRIFQALILWANAARRLDSLYIIVAKRS